MRGYTIDCYEYLPQSWGCSEGLTGGRGENPRAFRAGTRFCAVARRTVACTGIGHAPAVAVVVADRSRSGLGSRRARRQLVRRPADRVRSIEVDGRLLDRRR